MTREEALARADLAKLLEDVGDGRGLRVVRGMYPCPDLAHAQSGDSPPVAVRDRGGIDVWYCHSCEKGGSYIDALVACGRARDAADALESLGVTKPDRERQASAPIGDARAVAWYEYVDAQGAPLYRVVRYEPKTFRQQRWEDGEWKPGRGDAPSVPYRLPRILDAVRRDEMVFIVEGEKDVEALERQGRTATTNAGGSGKWEPAFADLLGPRARVVVVADDDDAGYKHARDVEAKLYGKVGLLLVRRPAEGFKDVGEMVAADVRVDSSTLRKLPEPAAGNGNGSISGALMLTARAMAARPASSDALQVVGPLFQRGMRTTIGAQTGEGKTTLAMQAVKAVVSGKSFLDDAWKPRRLGRALIVDLEQGEETVKARLREAGLDESDAVDVLWEPSGLALDSDASHRALIRDTLRQGGYDLVVLDPLYQLHRGDANNERVAADVIRYVDEWARDFNCSIVVPMHARKPHPDAGKNMTIHDIAGSSTWNRNAEFVVGLQLLSAGMSRVWFFKDRIGKGPEIRKWWGLSFRRADGFGRNFVEDQNARSAQAKEALASEAGVTRDEVARILGVSPDDEVGRKRLESALRRAHEQDGRYRMKPWQIAGQTSLLGNDD